MGGAPPNEALENFRGGVVRNPGLEDKPREFYDGKKN